MKWKPRESQVFAEARNRKRTHSLVALLSCLLLAACGDNQMAFFKGDDPSQSVSLVREQSYAGGPWQTSLIVAADSRCQRRYPLETLSADQLRIDVYRPEAGVYIFFADKRWHVTSLESCAFQTYEKPPPEPGELIGSFQVESGLLRFVGKLSDGKSSDGVAPASPAGR